MSEPRTAELLLERDRELESLRSALRDATSGGGGLALVEGPAGGYGEVLRQTEGVVDAQVFFDADTWRLLRALRTHWDPNGVLLANHEIKAPAS